MSRHLDHESQPPEDVDAIVNHDILKALVTNVDVVQQHTHERGGAHVYVGEAGSSMRRLVYPSS
jgi:hypothetical protein